MALHNPTINEYLVAARQKINTQHLPPPLTAIVQDYFAPKDGAAFVALIRDILTEHMTHVSDNLHSIASATLLQISERQNGGDGSEFTEIQWYQKNGTCDTRGYELKPSSPGMQHPSSSLIESIFAQIIGCMTADCRPFEVHMCPPAASLADYVNYDLGTLVSSATSKSSRDNDHYWVWMHTLQVIRCNAHCARVGVRFQSGRLVGSPASRGEPTLADIYVETKYGELITVRCTYEAYRDREYIWVVDGDGECPTPPDEWPPCTFDCSQCEIHCDAFHESKGIEWIVTPTLADKLRSMKGRFAPIYRQIADHVEPATIKIGILHFDQDEAVVVFDTPANCRRFNFEQELPAPIIGSLSTWQPHKAGFCNCEECYMGPHRETRGVEWIW